MTNLLTALLVIRSISRCCEQKFPNLFFLYGPHGPTAYSNGPSTVEVQAEWVCEFIKYMRDNKIQSFDVQPEAEAKFGEHINDLSAKTLFHESHGWYMGRNIPGKPVQALNFTVSTATLLFSSTLSTSRLLTKLLC